MRATLINIKNVLKGFVYRTRSKNGNKNKTRRRYDNSRDINELCEFWGDARVFTDSQKYNCNHAQVGSACRKWEFIREDTPTGC